AALPSIQVCGDGDAVALERKGVCHEASHGKLRRREELETRLERAGTPTLPLLVTVEHGPLDPELARPHERHVELGKNPRGADQDQGPPAIGDSKGIVEAGARPDAV